MCTCTLCNDDMVDNDILIFIVSLSATLWLSYDLSDVNSGENWSTSREGHAVSLQSNGNFLTCHKADSRER